LIVALLALAGCSGDDECLTDLDASCAPLYEPTFENVFDNTLKPTCGLPGRSCHATEGRKGGLFFAEADEAHELLVEGGRVEAGNPACSLIMRRLESEDPSYQMPPGRQLSAAERCAIQQWIENGAMR
jgi:hypothetical protein